MELIKLSFMIAQRANVINWSHKTLQTHVYTYILALDTLPSNYKFLVIWYYS